MKEKEMGIKVEVTQFFAVQFLHEELNIKKECCLEGKKWYETYMQEIRKPLRGPCSLAMLIKIKCCPFCGKQIDMIVHEPIVDNTFFDKLSKEFSPIRCKKQKEKIAANS